MESLPIQDLVDFFNRSLDYGDRARLASVNREYHRAFFCDRVTGFQKFCEFIRRLGRVNRRYLEIAFRDYQGYVLLTVLQRSRRIYYKLDGVMGTPEFDLNDESFQRFIEFVKTQWNDISDCDIVSNNRKNEMCVREKLASVFSQS